MRPVRRMISRARRIFRGVGTGASFAKRRNAEVQIVNSGALGTFTISGTNPSSLITLGAPVAAAGYGYNVPFSMQFSLDQLINYTDFNIFDKYRISAVKVTFRYMHNTSTLSATTGLPSMYAYVDRDDASVPTASAVRENMATKKRSFSGTRNEASFYFKPTPLMEAYPLSYIVPRKAPYFDTSSNAVPHYGLKGFLANCNAPAGSANVTCFNVDVTYYVSLRHIQ